MTDDSSLGAFSAHGNGLALRTNINGRNKKTKNETPTHI